MGESRIVGDQLLTTGEVWADEHGDEYFWTGERHREVTDPAGLKAALEPYIAAAGVLALRAFKNAFKPQPDRTYITELERIAKFAPETEPVIRDFTRWKEGPCHLRPIEEKGK
jgi:hypothetical protein